jgi:hypothetical protein
MKKISFLIIVAFLLNGLAVFGQHPSKFKVMVGSSREETRLGGEFEII